MRTVSFIEYHRRSILCVLIAMVVSGLVAAYGLPVSLFPNVIFPRIAVTINAGDRPADQMEIAITWPIEQAVRAIPGVTGVRSDTSRGSADLSVSFFWGNDMERAFGQVQNALAQVIPTLPPGTTAYVRRMDPTVFPIAAYNLTSQQADLIPLQQYAEFQLAPELSAIDGIAKVSTLSGTQPEYRVEINPDRLYQYRLTLNDVAAALSAINTLQSVGRIEDQYKLFLIFSDSQLITIKDINDTVLRTGQDGIIRLGDIATVRLTGAPRWVRVTADGTNAVSIQIYQQPNANTVQIVKDLQRKMEEIKNKMPKGVHVSKWYDQSELIVNSARSVGEAIVVGIFLAAFVLFVFLRSVKITLVTILVVPSVLAATALLLAMFNMSFNIMTLGGMAAAIGLIVDDAIVMIEHIERRLSEDDRNRPERIKHAAWEFFRPLVGSSMATILIFVPLAFLSGVTGAFFKALSITMASALFISFIVSWLVVPMLTEHLLPKDIGHNMYGHTNARLQEWFRRLVTASVSRPWFSLSCVIPFMLAGLLAYSHLGSGFMPSIDEGGFVLDYLAAPGTSVTETDRLLLQVEDILRATPEVETYSRRTGARLSGNLAESNRGDFFIKLKPPPRRSLDKVMQEIQSKVTERVAGLHISTAKLMEDLIGNLTNVPEPIEIKLFSDDNALLGKTAVKVAEAIGKVPGVISIKNGIIMAGDALNIKIDAASALQEGIDPAEATRQIRALMAGEVATKVQNGITIVGVRVWIPEAFRSRIDQINQMQLRSSKGYLFPLSRIAKIEAVTGQPQITRDNLRRMIAVTARISGRDMGSTVNDIKTLLDRPGMLSPGISYTLGGLYHEQQTAFRGLMGVFAAALAIIFALLMFLYERFPVVLSILAMPLLAMSPVLIGLWLTGINLDIMSMMGMTMIVGIVTEVAIFYFTEHQELLRAGHSPKEALINAALNRARPILMTTLAAILALLPLSLALGAGAEMQQPLAVAIIAGLMAQVPLVLLVMPALYQVITSVSRNKVPG